MVNNCLFLENVAVTTAVSGRTPNAFGGAIASSAGKLTVVDSIFKKNKAIATASGSGEGGAIYAGIIAGQQDVLVLSSVFESNEASNVGGAARFFFPLSVAWYNNKELLFGNDALDCDGAKVFGGDCFNVTDNFSL